MFVRNCQVLWRKLRSLFTALRGILSDRSLRSSAPNQGEGGGADFYGNRQSTGKAYCYNRAYLHAYVCYIMNIGLTRELRPEAAVRINRTLSINNTELS